MKRLADDEMRLAFLGWQCRVRQIAMREHGGHPMPGMQPRVSLASGEVAHPGATVLLVPEEPEEAIAFFRFQVQKTADPRRIYESVMAYLQGDYYQDPKRFSGELVAVFGAGSPTARRLAEAKRCLLDFGQWRQSYRLPASVRALEGGAPARELALWHNRAFNASVGNDAEVVAFKPRWSAAQADPLP